MKKLITVLVLAVLSFGSLTAQDKRAPGIFEIAEVEDSDTGQTTLSFFSIRAEDGTDLYYLDVGMLGAGDDVVQVLFDPVFRLFIPMGSTLAEAVENLEELQQLFKSEPGTTREMEASFAPLLPDERRETATVTYRKIFLSKKLMFSLEREGYIRATYVSKSDLGQLVSNAKWYKRTHPKEK